ncbi:MULTISPECIES: hypothetical protein [Clostridium]|uniref:Uncharacterized protein n=1 Tax=Clostridium cibarium TaxID=2762247 RepID=A0ABR8PNV4_9CLOT|nr:MULTISPECIES: hypothetical protein [Clostridium]MBD7909857.1 hypothetical protein [Clostridium cibarium]
MPYKLNLFDISVRKEMVEAVKANKVHRKKDNVIDTRVRKSVKEDGQEKNNKQNKSKTKKYITVDGVKYKGEKIEISADKSQDSFSEDSVGIFINKVK